MNVRTMKNIYREKPEKNHSLTIQFWYKKNGNLLALGLNRSSTSSFGVSAELKVADDTFPFKKSEWNSWILQTNPKTSRSFPPLDPY